MKMEIIKNYIKKLNKEDIKYFLEDNDIYIDDEKIDSLFLIVKNNYEDIINEEKNVLDKIKSILGDNHFNKLLSLLRKYKNIYLK
ncbi:MAG: hypothetical protein IIZ40_03820 [Bacilli bacterium]|nr:hypothetical protein [Bacilli bacterium]